MARPKREDKTMDMKDWSNIAAAPQNGREMVAHHVRCAAQWEAEAARTGDKGAAAAANFHRQAAAIMAAVMADR